MKRIVLRVSRWVGWLASVLEDFSDWLYASTQPPPKQLDPAIVAILTDGLLRLREHVIMPRSLFSDDE